MEMGYSVDEAKAMSLSEYWLAIYGKLWHSPNEQEEVEESESAADFAAQFKNPTITDDDDEDDGDYGDWD